MVPNPARTLAALDLGTNSFHLVVARTRPDGGFEIVDREKEPVRLGSGAGDMKTLTPAAVERGLAALGRMKAIAARHGAPIRAVATSALREAENREVFVRAAHERHGIDVEVVSGVEEARLIHLGVLQAVPVFDERALFVDIGGGSTEVTIGERDAELAVRSFKLGAVRLTDRFFPTTQVSGERAVAAAVQACRHHVRSTVAAFVREVDRLGFGPTVGSSGTIEAVAAVAAALDGTTPKSFANHEMKRADVARVVEALAAAPTVAARRRVPGVEAARADILLAGAVLLDELLDAFGGDRLIVSEYALREGVLLDTLQRAAAGTPGVVVPHLDDVSRRSVAAMVDAFDDDPAHARHVARLATRLFDDLAPVLPHLDAGARDFLEAGTLLANVGLFIGHSRHHQHSYYLVRNTDRLVGFTDDEIELIALVARYHRKSAPKPSHAEFASLSRQRQRTVRTLAGIARVAIGLDRNHDGRVADVRVRCSDTVLIEPVVASDADVALERYAADQRKGLLEEALGRRVRIGEAVRRDGADRAAADTNGPP
jgi:exopolyphosphatase/guanosine-5'-triphosphate,3'-diphosphate pyrophosphatase